MASITIKRGNVVPSLTQTLSPTQTLPSLRRFPLPVHRYAGGVAVYCGQTGPRLLSSTCLPNDCNYFPGLQATHACFISTSTSPICLHGDAWHTLVRWEKNKKKRIQQSILFPSIPFLWVPTGFSSLGSFTEGPRSFMVPEGFCCRDWQMLLRRSHDGLDADKDT